jgi:predicted metalloprotease with PDZ domain
MIRHLSHCVGILFICLIAMSTASAQNASVKYRLSMDKPDTHYFDVEMEFPNNGSAKTQVYMPVWTPGSYLEREFERNVQEFEAKDSSGKQLPFEKINKSTWEIATAAPQTIKVHYRVYAFELSVRTSYLDDTHGYVNGASVFMIPRGMEQQPIQLDIKPYQGWTKISTGLDRTAGAGASFTAPNYDILVDSPIEIGNQAIYEFDVAGTPHYLSIYGTGNQDPQRMIADLKKIVTAAHNIFGEFPYRHYTFLLQLLQTGGGGLEHLNSNSIEVARNTFYPEERYKSWLSVSSHEYFHAWNVKRIRPIALGPFDYLHENYTHMLWVAEGFTDYYGSQLLVRAGLYSQKEYLDRVANEIKSEQTTPGRHFQSATEASFDAWVKGYRPNENSLNSTISYYTKGALIATLLDLEIRNHTDGQKTLDDLMRFLMNEYYEKQKRGYTDDEFQKAASQIAGEDLTAFFKQTAESTEELNYDRCLNYAGLKLVTEVDPKNRDKGYLGATATEVEGRLVVSTVIFGTPAYEQGLYARDEIIAINGNRIPKSTVDELMTQFKPGTAIQLTVARDGRLKEIIINLSRWPAEIYKLVKMENTTDRQKRIFKAWVGSDF